MATFYNIGDKINTNKFGEITILSKAINGGWNIKFHDTGTVATALSGDITRGNVRDYNSKVVCGIACFGYGTHKAKINGKDTDSYKCWNHMISRCYNKKDKSFNRYGGRGVFVCDDWLTFQIFADWYKSNYPKDGNKYELDKDIKFEGNKEYSPTRCLFVSKKENTIKATAKSYTLTSPSGELCHIYNMSDFCLKNNLTISAATTVARGIRRVHKGWTKGD